MNSHNANKKTAPDNAPIYLDQTDTHAFTPTGVTREYTTIANPSDKLVFNRFVEDGVYIQALSALVVRCVDILVYDPETEQVLIGTRQQEPQPGDWVIGGRMRAGESTSDSAARNMMRELKLDIDTTKLKKVGSYELIWDTREQPDFVTKGASGEDITIKGCHMSSNLDLYPLSPQEKQDMQFNSEYSDAQWVNISDILDSPRGKYHPALVDMVKDGLDVLTTPESPKNKAEQKLRLLGELATIKSKLRNL